MMELGKGSVMEMEGNKVPSPQHGWPVRVVIKTS